MIESVLSHCFKQFASLRILYFFIIMKISHTNFHNYRDTRAFGQFDKIFSRIFRVTIMEMHGPSVFHCEGGKKNMTQFSECKVKPEITCFSARCIPRRRLFDLFAIHRANIILMFVLLTYLITFVPVVCDKDVICSKYAILKKLKSVYFTKKVSKDAVIDLQNIIPLYEKITTGLQTANTLISNEKSPPSNVFIPPKPFYITNDFMYYVLPDRYELRKSIAACNKYGLRLFRPLVPSSKTVPILKALEKKSISKIPSIIKSHGNILTTDQGKYVDLLKTYEVKSATTLTPAKRQEKFRSYNNFVSFLKLNAAKDTYLIDPTDASERTSSSYICCQGPTRIDRLDTERGEIVQEMLTQFKDITTSLLPLFKKRQSMQEEPTKTQDGISNAITLFPSHDLVQLVEDVEFMSTLSNWQDGIVDYGFLSSMLSQLKALPLSAKDQVYHLKISKVPSFKISLGIPTTDFVSPDITFELLAKTTSVNDYKVHTRLGIEMADKDQMMTFYRIFPNNFYGEITTHPYIVQSSKNSFVSDIDPMIRLNCNDDICKSKTFVKHPAAILCASTLLSKSDNFESCERKLYNFPIGYRHKCTPNSDGILSLGQPTTLNVECANTVMKSINPPVGISYINSTCALKLGNLEILAPFPRGKNKNPPIFADDEIANMLLYQILGGTTLGTLISVLVFGILLYRKVTNQRLCCFHFCAFTKAGQNGKKGTYGFYRDSKVPSNVDKSELNRFLQNSMEMKEMLSDKCGTLSGNSVASAPIHCP